MPARRDYADAWRDSWATLAQVPVASLLAADHFYRRWVEVSSTYLSHVSTRLALARPAAAADATPDKSVMADVLSEDLVEVTRALVRDVVSLPGQTATFFNEHLEDMVREVLARVQPDAKTDVRTYVVNELEKLNRELYRLREVAGAETARGEIAGPDKPPVQPGPLRGLEQALNVIQARANAALEKFPPNAPRKRARKDEASRVSDLAARVVLAIRRAEDEVGGVLQEIHEEIKGSTKPRARREVRRTRR
jgi:hypothetical protein